MLKHLLLSVLILVMGLTSCSTSDHQQEITQLRQLHEQHLANSPFKNTQLLSKAERKELGIPPNKYLERQWELTMNPKIGRPTPENLIDIRKDMLEALNSGKTLPGHYTNLWVERGPGNVGGRSKAVMFDPNDPSNQKVWAGAVSGGLWFNNNITSPNSPWHITGLPHNLAVTSIAYDPNDTQVFYVGTGESYTGGAVNGNGVWKSTDGGLTWTHVFGGKDGESEMVSNATFSVNSPSNLQGDFYAIKAAFGDTEFTSYTGSLVLVDDGSTSPTLACDPLTNGAEISGNIAVIERGDCYFVDKVSHAEAEGAIGVLMINNVSGGPITMGAGSNPPAINIPSVMISKSDGVAILEALANGENIDVTITNNNTDIAYGYVVPGITHINDVVTRNNNGVTEIYATAGDSYYSDASNFTILGHGYQGLYKSVDGGETWTQVTLPEDPDGNPFTPNDLEIAADNSIWLTTTRSTYYGAAHGAVLSSTDGDSFDVVLPVTNYGRMELAVSKTDPGKMYLVAINYGGSTPLPFCLKTTDGFNANMSIFNKPNGDASPANDFTNGQGYYDLAIEVDPNDDDVLYLGGIDLFKSTNAGTSWTQISSYYGYSGSTIHPDQQGIAINPNNSNLILFANDGGVSYSGNGGASISPRYKNYVTTQFYHMAVAPTTAFSGDYFMAGAQDNGTQLFENAPQTVSDAVEAQGGDGAYCFFDQDGTDKYRISNYVFNNNIRLFNYNTLYWKTINSESSDHGDFINQEALDSNLDILYTNYTTRSSSGYTYAIRRYSNLLGSISKTLIQDGTLMRSTPIAFKVSPFTTTSSKLFVGLANGILLRIDNADTNPVFNDITGIDFIGSISDIEFGQSEDEIFVTIFNYGVTNIFYTNDGGATWVSKEGDLPDMPVNTILQNPLVANEVIIGTDLGVWGTTNFDDASPNWYPVYNGMSDVKVTDLELRDDNAVFASTYGRGIFSSQFTSDITSVQEGDLVEIKVYPNPAADFINVTIPHDISAVARIYDINGREVLHKNIENSHRVSFDISALSKGYYFVQLTNDQEKYTAKFIVK